jgi:hypothetical protein
MHAEKHDDHDWPGDPRQQIKRARQPFRRFHLEANLDRLAQFFDHNLHVPPSCFGQLEDGGLEKFVGRRCRRRGLMDAFVRMLAWCRAHGDSRFRNRFPGGVVLEEDAHVHDANSRWCRRGEDGDAVASALFGQAHAAAVRVRFGTRINEKERKQEQANA